MIIDERYAFSCAIEGINDEALKDAMWKICGKDLDDDSPEWEKHGDAILSLQTEFFDDEFTFFLSGLCNNTSVTAEQVVKILKAHCHQRLSEILGEKYIDDWYDNFLENESKEAAE